LSGSEEGAGQDAPSIRLKANGSIRVHGLTDFRNSRGEPIETKPDMKLCRCGHAADRLFCDGTHKKIGFQSAKDPDRTPDRLLDYKAEGITVHDNRGVCDRNGICSRLLPAVFQPGKPRWIRPDAASPEEIARVIRLCPSGALSYTIDGVLYKDYDRPPAIEIAKDGPYRVVGGIPLDDADGAMPESAEHYTLCRCGVSRNKPFCTGHHGEAGFHDDQH
jgi:CDGSH-type Zn-finger protein